MTTSSFKKGDRVEYYSSWDQVWKTGEFQYYGGSAECIAEHHAITGPSAAWCRWDHHGQVKWVSASELRLSELKYDPEQQHDLDDDL